MFKSDTTTTNGLKPHEVNMTFLGVQEEINSLLLGNNNAVITFSCRLTGHISINKDNEIEIITVNQKFEELLSTQQFLQKTLGLVIPMDDKTVQGVNAETIEKVYKQILLMTCDYLTDSCSENLGYKSNDKEKIFNQLNNILINPNETKYQRLQNFAKILKHEDRNMLDQHRTPDWIRYVRNALSFLTILPAIAMAIHSYYQYGTAQFWKPTSEKIKMAALHKCETVNFEDRLTLEPR